jgi:steroid Delta-isomerase
MNTLERARAYARYFDTLTPASKHTLKALVHPDVRFVDPFNDVRGAKRLMAVFDHMFETTKDPRFVTEPPAVAGDTAFIKWRFTCTIEQRFYQQAMRIDGVTEVAFDDDGLITAHIDHWDAAGQLYEKLPLLGGLLRLVRQRLAAPG